MHDLRPRLAGLALIVASGGSSLLHRQIWRAAAHGPAQLAEFALALTSFVLASIGVLLVIHGARLFRAAAPRPSRPRASRLPLPAPGLNGRVGELDTRYGVALMLARQALTAAAERRGPSPAKAPREHRAA